MNNPLKANFINANFTLGFSGFTRFQNKQGNRESIFYWYLGLVQFK